MKELARERIVKKFALEVFKILFHIDGLKRIKPYLIKKDSNHLSFKDEELSLTSLFLQDSLLNLRKVNSEDSHHWRWYETPSFLIDDKLCFLTGEWNAPKDYSLSIPNIGKLVEKYYNLTVEKKGEDWLLINKLDSITNSISSRLLTSYIQQIFFGAPGTGKSHKVNELVGEPKSFLVANDREARFGQFSQCGCAKANHYADVLSKPETFNQDVFAIDNLGELKSLLESCDGDDKVKNPRHSALRAYIDFVSQPMVFRTTFHPDYDYAQFVGSYKPKKDKDDPKRIVYDFVPQVFAKAYKRAKETSEPVYLVIEEINRGNCAQIFGDIFQLLDRNESGESQYEIDVDSDFAEWLGESKIKLPSNFNILATMNTSDQSLFPMDSAFKRRFDWEYVPISFEGKSAANFQIEIGSSENVKYYSWQTFVEKVNAKILDLTESEDKQLGEYFIQPDKKLNDSDTEKTVISEERFKGKVMFYLWNEICKDEHKNGSFFKIENDFFTFQDLYKDDSKLAAFMEEIEKTGKN